MIVTLALDCKLREIETWAYHDRLIRQMEDNERIARDSTYQPEMTSSEKYDRFLKDIGAIRGSDQVYDLRIDDSLSTEDYYRGGVDFDESTGNIVIIMPSKWDDGLFFHELTHCIQFEEGRMSFQGDKNAPYVNLLYDLTDEREAYEVQSWLGGTPPPDWENLYMRNNHLEDIDRHIRPYEKDALQRTVNRTNQVVRYDGVTYMPDVVRKAIEDNNKE